MDPDASDELLNALENETNSAIMNLTTRKIKEHKNNVLQQLQIKGPELKKFHEIYIKINSSNWKSNL